MGEVKVELELENAFDRERMRLNQIVEVRRVTAATQQSGALPTHGKAVRQVAPIVTEEPGRLVVVIVFVYH